MPHKVQEEGELSPEQIIKMDWLAENVIGSIPPPSELTEEAQLLVALQGIRRSEEPVGTADSPSI